MRSSVTSRGVSLVQTVLLGVTAAGVLYLNSRVLHLEGQLEQLKMAQADTQPAATAQESQERRSLRADPRVASVEGSLASSALSGGGQVDGDGSVTTIDDHLWSQDGREAIGDVIDEREDEERDRRTERWLRMMEYRTEQTVSSVSDELGLTADQSEQVTKLVNAYMEIRSQRWRQMSDDDVDFAEVEREYEESRDQIEQDLIDVIGDEGLEMLQEEMRRGWR